MKRILIFGSIGSGKSTLANRMHDKLGLPVICLDQHFWKPGWQLTDDEEWFKKVEELVRGESWIMEGNYMNTLDMRLPAADTIILLDRSRFLCLYRLLKRIIGNREHGKIDNCEEKLNFRLLFVTLWKFPQFFRKKIIVELEKVKDKKSVFILKSNKDVERFLVDNLE